MSPPLPALAPAGRSPAVDDYIAAFALPTRHMLDALRRVIWLAAPGVSELINYGIPAFALVPGGRRDQQVMMAGYARHVGFYPSVAVMTAFADRLAGYRRAKGSVQFALDQPLPEALVTEMVAYRLAALRHGG